ncbi:MAG: hypothetical protein IK031_02385 [Bacteroidales bacterium]|nr:hypothetical protein [Bacteroidales bacterium]
MKNAIVKILLLLVFAGVAAPAGAQKKIYTRSYRVQDFKSRTTKVVLGSAPGLDAVLREDITAFWTASAYEFCTPAEYEKQKTDPGSYFLRPVTEKGIVYLVLTKGGREKDADALKHPMNLVSVPVAGENWNGSLLYMPAFITMIQDYAEAAMTSERVAYSGLKGICRWRRPGTRVVKDPEEAASAFRDAREGVAVQVTITPDGSSASKPRHRLVFSADGYQLHSYR